MCLRHACFTDGVDTAALKDAIGVLTDMTGPFSDISGPGAVTPAPDGGCDFGDRVLVADQSMSSVRITRTSQISARPSRVSKACPCP
jgi:hypothetical protein